MSETTRENVGRNDPCPCGSGRKYKKCCQRADRLQKESEKKANEPHRLVGSATIPYKVYKVLREIHGNNALGLFYDLSHELGPFRERFAEKSAFVQAVDEGDEVLPASRDFDFVHLRLDAPDVYLLLQSDDPKKDHVDFQIITLRRNELDAQGSARDVEHQGYRIWDIRRECLDRSEIDGTPSMDAFGIDWNPPLPTLPSSA